MIRHVQASLLAGLATAILVCPAMARAEDILAGRGIEITSYGIYDSDPTQERTVAAPESLSGVVRESADIHFTQTTTTVCAKIGTHFGIAYRRSGPDDGSGGVEPWAVEVAVAYPRLTTPEGRSGDHELFHTQVGTGGRADGWEFEYPYELAAGPWSFTVMHEGAVAARVTFTVRTECGPPIS